MEALNEQKRGELLDKILNLAMSCPVDKCNPEDCPLYKVRQMEVTMRLSWFDNLTDEDLVYLDAYHHACMKTKGELHKVEAGKRHGFRAD